MYALIKNRITNVVMLIVNRLYEIYGDFIDTVYGECKQYRNRGERMCQVFYENLTCSVSPLLKANFNGLTFQDRGTIYDNQGTGRNFEC